MTLSGKGKLHRHENDKTYVYVPVEVARDSQFPFSVGAHEVMVHINKGQKLLHIEKLEVEK